MDPRTEEGRLTLLSYVWPDQLQRIQRLRAALELAAAIDPPVERAGAAEWIEARLAEPAAGAVTVVFHSIVMQYLPDAERAHFEQAVAAAPGTVAWLRMEPGGDMTDLRLTLGGEERLLARAGYHGHPLDWLA